MPSAGYPRGPARSPPCKVVLLGEGRVGKTSLVLRFCKDSFSEAQPPTIQASYLDKQMTIGDKRLSLAIWDTAGQERFRSLTSNFFGRADGFASCFDVGARASFNHVRQWLDDVEKNKKGPVELALIGCKCDLAAEKRQVTRLEAEKLAGEKGLPYFEASAKTNQNVAEAFEDLAARVLRRKGPASSDAVLLADDAPTRRSRCCN